MNFSVLFEYLLITIAAIFVIVNPLTTAFVFMSLLPHADDAERRHVARRATIISTTIFFIFALLGSVIFKLFGITLEAFRIAGGLILFGIAMKMLRESSPKRVKPQPDAEGASTEIHDGRLTEDVSIIPLAIPFISGPGSIATVMILTSEAPSIYHTAIVFGAILLCTATCYYMMINSKYIVRYMGEAGREIITKVFGLILSVISVQFVINGVVEVWTNLPAGGGGE
ncbi:MAG: NAAT family transporter [Phycisphaeraceae bacterium]|nr:MAG: NAAT family transporter [Phycisphaeraceae bacterium]